MTTREPATMLSESQSWQLLRGTPFGRLAVVLDGNPDIFPVNHVVDHGSVVFRTGVGTKLMGSDGQRVAYEADGFDGHAQRAWSVVVKGRARQLRQLHEVVDSFGLPLESWQAGPKPRYVRIEVEQITGRRFASAGPDTVVDVRSTLQRVGLE